MNYFSIILQLVVLTTLWCNGVYISSNEKGDILFFLHRVTLKWGVWGKPVLHCINCMSSLHTIIVMLLYFWLSPIVALWWQYIIIWLIVCVICSFTNGLVYLLYEWISEMAFPSVHIEEDQKEVKYEFY